MTAIAAVVLAAGSSRRMGGVNKLLLEIDGEAMVARVVKAALASRANPVVVVTGHQGDAVAGVLAGLGVILVPNPDHAAGMSTSLKAGLAALPDGVDGVLVCLGDMPGVSAGLLDTLIAAVDGDHVAWQPVFDGRRGNPVLLSRALFAELMAITGDEGARSVLKRHGDRVKAVPVADPAIFHDVDVPGDMGMAEES